MYEKPYAAGRCPLMRLGKGRSRMWSGSNMTTYFSGMDTVVTHLLSCRHENCVCCCLAEVSSGHPETLRHYS